MLISNQVQYTIDVTVVHVVSVESLQLAAARKSFEVGFDRWLSVHGFWFTDVV